MFTDCIRNRIHPATWAVLGYKKDLAGHKVAQRGTGFAVDVHGHILTCWHVTYMDDAYSEEPDFVEILQPTIDVKRRLRAKVIARDKKRDLAVLELEDRSIRTPAVQLHAGERIPWGRTCCAFGHPLGVAAEGSIRIFTRAAGGLLSMAFTANRFPDTGPIRMYEVDFFAHGGLSGGPLFASSGIVFGVVSGSLVLQDQSGGQPAARSNLSIAIDIAEAIQLLEPLDIHPQLAGHVVGNVVSKDSKHGGTSRKKKSRRRH